MKTVIICACALINSIVGFGQEANFEKNSIQGELINLKNTNNTILYRGFVNQFRFNTKNLNQNESLIFKAINSDITAIKQDALGYSFTITTKLPAAKAQLVILNANSDSLLFDFTLANLPVPSTFLSGFNSNEKISFKKITSLGNIAVGYEPDITLDAKFDIISWEANITKMMYKGTDNKLSNEALTAISQLKSEEKFQLVLFVGSEDKLYRKNTSEFTIE